jgi:hypothetical protein
MKIKIVFLLPPLEIGANREIDHPDMLIPVGNGFGGIRRR